MQFFFTGAKIPLDIQNNPDLSLGGNVSATVVPNGLINNLFGDISVNGKQKGNRECRAICLSNTLGVNVNNVNLGFRYPNDGNPINYKFEFGIVVINNNVMELINDPFASPYNCTFYEPIITDTTDSSLILPDMASGAKLGIWIRRTLINSVIPNEDDFLKNLTINNIKNITQTVKIVLKYDTP